MRLIDADALLDDMKKELKKAVKEDLQKDECMVIMTSAIALKDFVNRQPTVEAKPVVHCRECCFLEVCKTSQWLGIDGYCSRGEKHD